MGLHNKFNEFKLTSTQSKKCSAVIPRERRGEKNETAKSAFQVSLVHYLIDTIALGYARANHTLSLQVQSILAPDPCYVAYRMSQMTSKPNSIY